VWHRVIQGRPYLLFPDMNGGDLFVYRFDPENVGEIAIPCARLSTNAVWTDANENGCRDEGGTTAQTTGETRGWFVEENGTVWQATRRAGIFEYPLISVRGSGVPVYEVSARRHTAMPAPLTELRRVIYDRTSDAMYLVWIEDDDYAKNVMYRWQPQSR
jgi:hypothetical protein